MLPAAVEQVCLSKIERHRTRESPCLFYFSTMQGALLNRPPQLIPNGISVPIMVRPNLHEKIAQELQVKATPRRADHQRRIKPVSEFSLPVQPLRSSLTAGNQESTHQKVIICRISIPTATEDRAHLVHLIYQIHPLFQPQEIEVYCRLPHPGAAGFRSWFL